MSVLWLLWFGRKSLGLQFVVKLKAAASRTKRAGARRARNPDA